MSKREETLDLRKITRDDLIYLAGLIDGDGCFFISKKKEYTAKGEPVYMIKLQIHCINEPFIDNLFATFGGVKVVYRKKSPRRWLYGIEFTGKLLTQICELLLPFLRLKKENCQNMLNMRKTYNGRGGRISVPPNIIAFREQCFQISRGLNTHKPLNELPPCCPSA